MHVETLEQRGISKLLPEAIGDKEDFVLRAAGLAVAPAPG